MQRLQLGLIGARVPAAARAPRTSVRGARRLARGHAGPAAAAPRVTRPSSARAVAHAHAAGEAENTVRVYCTVDQHLPVEQSMGTHCTRTLGTSSAGTWSSRERGQQ